jgi:hypothetical protein
MRQKTIRGALQRAYSQPDYWKAKEKLQDIASQLKTHQ